MRKTDHAFASQLSGNPAFPKGEAPVCNRSV